jgi:flagellar hook-associated protein 1 FlgK
LGGSAPPAATDRFQLEPVGRAASGMLRTLDDPAGIAAAAPESATLGTANTGTASIASLEVVSASNNPKLSVDLAFTTANGDYTWQIVDRGTGAVSSSGSGTWAAGQPITLNGTALSLNGVPAQGDTIAIDPTTHPESSNGNALAMVSLRDERFVGQVRQIDGSIADGATPTDAYASAIAAVGVRVQGAATAATISAAAASQATSAASAKSGVNLDEEAARLIQFQQGYQAAAKVLQVAQSVFNTMLQVASGA